MRKACYFAGHSRIYNSEEIYKKLSFVIERLITDEGVTEFRVGNYGDFYRLSAQVVRELKRKYPSVHLFLVIPYLTEEIRRNREYFYKNFDEIIIPDIPEYTPYSARIIQCNRRSVDMCEILVCHVEHTWGVLIKHLNMQKRKISE